jgi:hypothetical protein
MAETLGALLDEVAADPAVWAAGWPPRHRTRIGAG